MGFRSPQPARPCSRSRARLGVKLIDRSKRPLVATNHGKIFYEGCRDLVNRYLEIESRVKSLQDSTQAAGTITVASIYSVGLSHMSMFVRQFMEANPGAKVRLEYLHPTRVVESVCEGAADLGLVSFPKRWSDLTVIPWREEKMVLALYPGHRLASRESVRLSEIEGERFIAFDEELSIRRAVDRYLRRHGVHLENTFEFDNIENIKRAVESEAGISILPEATLAQEIRSGALIKVSILEDPLSRPIAILHKRGGRLSQTASLFLDLLMDSADASSPGRTPVEGESKAKRREPLRA